MNLLDSLLDTIVRLDGDALVMHVGEKPYVVTTSESTNEFRGPLAWGQVELSSRVLTVDAVGGMLGQVLPLDQRAALDDYGATEYEVTAANNQLQRFTIVAARGGDDIWLEIRRHPKPKPEPVARHVGAAAPVEQPVGQTVAERSETPVAVVVTARRDPVEAQAEIVAPETASDVPRETMAEIEEPAHAETPVAHFEISAGAVSELHDTGSVEEILDIEPEPFNFESELEPELLAAAQDLNDDVMTEGDLGELLRASAAAIITGDDHEHEPPDWLKEDAIGDLSAQLFSASVGSDNPPAAEVTEAAAEPRSVVVDFVEPSAIGDRHVPILVESSDTREEEDLVLELPIEEHEEQEPAAVVETKHQREPEESAPLVEAARAALRAEAIAEEPQVAAENVAEVPAAQRVAGEMELRLVAEAIAKPLAAEPAETVAAVDEELSAPRPPAIVVPLPRHPKSDGAVGPRAAAGTALQRLLRLAAARGAATVYVVAQSAPMVRVDGEFSTLDGEPALSAAVIERLIAEVLPAGRDAASTSSEWLIDVPEIGRVRCVTFRDHRGPGVIFRMVPARAISADQLGLSAEVQALSTEADGLILVAGARGGGKSTLLTSFVDLINRTRSDHVITIESQIEFVHESKRSFVSQREVRGDGDAFVAAVRAACREEADVLVIDDMRTPEAVSLALEASDAGRLVCASVPGLSIASALERIIEMFPAERRENVQASLAGSLRGVVSQILLRKLRGGRVAAREVLLNTPAVASLILEGKIFELPAAIESGRRGGMMSFAESLAALVRDGTVHPSHAHRKAPNREQFLAILRREGVDISVAERLA